MEELPGAEASHRGAPATFRRWSLRAGLALGVLVALFAVYVLAANLILRTRLLRSWISEDPDALRIDWRSASTFLPGRVHVEGLSLRGADDQVEWILGIDQCDVRIALPDLFSRRFRATRVRADGVTLRLRRRLARGAAGGAVGLPPIEGFADPPLERYGPPAPPLTDATYRLWSIDLEDVGTSRVREIWVDQIRASGEMAVFGRWTLRPLRELAVGPAAIAFGGAEIGRGEGARWATDVHGDLGVTITPAELRGDASKAVLEALAVHGDVRASFAPGDLVTDLLAKSRIEMKLGSSETEADVSIERGVVGEGTRVRIAPLAASARLPQAGVELGGRVGLAVDVDAHGVAAAKLVGEDVRASVAGVHLRSSRIAVGLQSEALQLDARPLADVGRAFEVDTPDVTLPNLAALAPLLPKGLALERGVAHAEGHLALDLRRHVARGSVRVRAESARLRVGSDTLEGPLRGSLEARPRGDRTDLSGSTIELDDRTRGWWARAKLPTAALVLGDRPRLAMRFAAEAQDASPIAALIATQSAVPKWALDALSTKGLQVTGDLVAGEGFLEARDVRARSESVDVGFELARRGNDERWAALVAAGALRVGVGEAGGKPDVRLFDAQPWFAREVVAIRQEESPGLR